MLKNMKIVIIALLLIVLLNASTLKKLNQKQNNLLASKVLMKSRTSDGEDSDNFWSWISGLFDGESSEEEKDEKAAEFLQYNARNSDWIGDLTGKLGFDGEDGEQSAEFLQTNARNADWIGKITGKLGFDGEDGEQSAEFLQTNARNTDWINKLTGKLGFDGEDGEQKKLFNQVSQVKITRRKDWIDNISSNLGFDGEADGENLNMFSQVKITRRRDWIKDIASTFDGEDGEFFDLAQQKMKLQKKDGFFGWIKNLFSGDGENEDGENQGLSQGHHNQMQTTMQKQNKKGLFGWIRNIFSAGDGEQDGEGSNRKQKHHNQMQTTLKKQNKKGFFDWISNLFHGSDGEDGEQVGQQQQQEQGSNNVLLHRSKLQKYKQEQNVQDGEGQAGQEQKQSFWQKVKSWFGIGKSDSDGETQEEEQQVQEEEEGTQLFMNRKQKAQGKKGLFVQKTKAKARGFVDWIKGVFGVKSSQDGETEQQNQEEEQQQQQSEAQFLQAKKSTKSSKLFQKWGNKVFQNQGEWKYNQKKTEFGVEHDNQFAVLAQQKANGKVQLNFDTSDSYGKSFKQYIEQEKMRIQNRYSNSFVQTADGEFYAVDGEWFNFVQESGWWNPLNWFTSDGEDSE